MDLNKSHDVYKFSANTDLNKGAHKREIIQAPALQNFQYMVKTKSQFKKKKKKHIQIKARLPLALLTWIIPSILMGLFE